MKSLQTIVTRVVTGIRHWIVLFCERSRYWLAGVGGPGYTLKQWRQPGKKFVTVLNSP